ALLPPLVPADGAESIFVPLVIVLICLATYVAGIFLLAFEVDLASRASCYPSRLLRLPVPTGWLAFWPQVAGAVAMGLLWVFSARFILNPWLRLWDEHVSLGWPAFLLTAIL